MSQWTGGLVSSVEAALSAGSKIWILQMGKNGDVVLIDGVAWIFVVVLIEDLIFMINLLARIKAWMKKAELWNREAYFPDLFLFLSGGLARYRINQIISGVSEPGIHHVVSCFDNSARNNIQ